MSSDHAFHYAIVGGGITGLSLAIALHHRGISTTLYEQGSSLRDFGAGVVFTPNALQAMRICHPGVYNAFKTVRTGNVWESKQNVWLDIYDGVNARGDEAKDQPPAFTIYSEVGNAGVHRAKFLDELVQLVPPGIVQFDKDLQSIHERHDGTMSMVFADGSTATANAILGCDGIRSKVRQVMFGAKHPCAKPAYTNKYAYRKLVPMADAVAALGEEKALNSCVHMGPGGHVLTFPIDQAETLCVMAFYTTKDEWIDSDKPTRPARKEDALRDFRDFGDNIKQLLSSSLAQPDLDIWPIHDTATNPPPSLFQGRICILGDAAHASSPHHGAGAGMGIEDCAILAELLSDSTVTSLRNVETALAVYDGVRRQRGQWLVQSSRFIGDCYEWAAKGVGEDFTRIEEEIVRRNGIIAQVNVSEMCEGARKLLRGGPKAIARLPGSQFGNATTCIL